MYWDSFRFVVRDLGVKSHALLSMELTKAGDTALKSEEPGVSELIKA
jgi:hypothetical protein